MYYASYIIAEDISAIATPRNNKTMNRRGRGSLL